MSLETQVDKASPKSRTGMLVTILLVCLVGGALYTVFRVPPDADSIAVQSVSPEPQKVVVEIPPELLQTPQEYLETDVGSLVSIKEPADVSELRRSLIQFLWGSSNLPASQSSVLAPNIEDARYTDVASSKSIDMLTVRMDFGLESHIYVFHPTTPNNDVILYHQGHRGGFHLSKKQIGAFLDHGYTVLAFSMPLVGLNNQPTVLLPRFGRLKLIDHDNLKFLSPDQGHPLQYFVEPVIAAINYLEAEASYSSISMVGISGGGWTTTLAAALDTRISKSFPVAGSYPLYLRSNSRRDWGDYEQTVPELYSIANYLELYTMGAFGDGRAQLQVINQLDACCFAGPKWETYADRLKKLVADLGSGEFDVFMDDTHMEHTLSPVTMDRILAELDTAPE